MRVCSTADAEPAPTSNLLDTFGRAFGFDLTDAGSAHRPRVPAGRGSHERQRDGSAVSRRLPLISSLPSMCCIRSPDADEHAAIAEMYRLLKPGGFALSSTSRPCASCAAITPC